MDQANLHQLLAMAQTLLESGQALQLSSNGNEMFDSAASGAVASGDRYVLDTATGDVLFYEPEEQAVSHFDDEDALLHMKNYPARYGLSAENAAAEAEQIIADLRSARGQYNDPVVATQRNGNGSRVAEVNAELRAKWKRRAPAFERLNTVAESMCSRLV